MIRNIIQCDRCKCFDNVNNQVEDWINLIIASKHINKHYCSTDCLDDDIVELEKAIDSYTPSPFAAASSILKGLVKHNG